MTFFDHRVHGLAANDTAPDWPALTGDEIADLLTHYPDVGELRAVRWHSPRPLSAAAVIDTATGPLFIKRHAQRVRTPSTLSEEHRYVAHLRQRGVPTPRVLRDAQDRSALAIGAWIYEVHEPAAGRDVYRDAISWSPLTDLTHARAAGAMLAKLHQAAADFHAPQRSTHILVARDELILAPDPIATLIGQLPERPGLGKFLAAHDWQTDFARVLLPRHARLQPQLITQPRLWTHNDWHASNLCWTTPGPNAQITSVLDFGLASPTFALFDLATAIERNAIAWLALDRGDGAVHIATALALLDGYHSVQPLGRLGVHTLADLLPLVHIDFALSEVEYFAAVTRSQANADIAYDTFLLGHAAWFDSAPAQRLLHALRASA